MWNIKPHYSFIIGKHYIIPTILLVITIILGNLAWYSLQKVRWAQYINFWIGFVVTCHLFFGIFWAKTPRKIVGDWFEPVAIALTVIMLAFTWTYLRRNQLFLRKN